MTRRYRTEPMLGVVLAGGALVIAAAFPSYPAILLAACVGALAARVPGASPGERSRGAEMEREHRLLLESVQHCPMPYALYDEEDRLLVWNEAYERIYARTFARLGDEVAARRLRYAELVRDSASERLRGDDLENHVSRRVTEQRLGDAVFDLEHPGFGWYRVSKHVTPSGGVAGYAIDINELKQREADLLAEVERRRLLEVRIRRLADTDGLTGVANRRHFIERAADAFARSVAERTPLCLLVIDIDHFKQVNDTYGHAAGDEALIATAGAIGKAIGGEEMLTGRLGGEEFAVLASEHGVETGRALAERIRDAIRTLSFAEGERRFAVTVSAGIAVRHVADRSVTDLLKRADDALYSAKRRGRDRIELAPSGATAANDATSIACPPARRAMR